MKFLLLVCLTICKTNIRKIVNNDVRLKQENSSEIIYNQESNNKQLQILQNKLTNINIIQQRKNNSEQIDQEIKLDKDNLISNLQSQQIIDQTEKLAVYIYQYDYEIHSFILFLLLIFVCIINNMRDFINNFLNEQFGELVTKISKDLIIVLFISQSIQILNFLDFFPNNIMTQVQIDSICIYMSLFAMTWLIISLISAFRCESYVQKWYEQEKQFSQQAEIHVKYEQIYLRANQESQIRFQDKFKQYRQTLEYLLMRQDFIAPSFFPIAAESFLRDDFFFAGYLNFALAKTLKKCFKIKLYSLIIIFFLYGSGRILTKPSLDKIAKFIAVVPLILTIALKLNLTISEGIYQKLVHIVQDPFDFMLTDFQQIRIPLINIDRIPTPQFLRCQKVLNSKQINYIRQNLQEKLFLLGSSDINLLFFHLLIMAQVLWMIFFLNYFFVNFSFFFILEIIVIIMCQIINIYYLIPKNMYYLCINTNIQMMKDTKIIRKVVNQQREKTSRVFQKFYRYIKQQRNILQLGNSSTQDTNSLNLNQTILKFNEILFKCKNLYIRQTIIF